MSVVRVKLKERGSSFNSFLFLVVVCGRMSDASRVVVCPWCWEKFPSQEAWAESFEKSHPIVSRVDSIVPVLNTPSVEAQFGVHML